MNTSGLCVSHPALTAQQEKAEKRLLRWQELERQGIHLTYQRQYRRCGNPRCQACRAGEKGHGPYWYAYYRDQRRLKSMYLGKHLPSSHPASFRYSKERGKR